MRRCIPLFAVCLLLAGLAVAGCGGGDEGTTAGDGGEAAAQAGAGGKEGESQSTGESAQPISEAQAEFVAKANAVCTKQQQLLQAKLRQAFKSGPGSQHAALLRLTEDAIGPAMEAEAEELRALGAPRGDEEQVEAIAAALEALGAEARKNPTRLVAGSGPFEKEQKLAQGYGIGACGRVA